ncbi:MAG: M4 family peptidase, partial [Sphingobacteriia bacterium]|nr:M4 family peptidase [Sphingobacteriia bacterium]
TPGTAATKYSGTQTITCDLANNQHTLRETARGLGVETYNLFNTMNYALNNFTSTTSTWSLSTFDQGALDAHWGAERTYDYFLNIHNRNSINNAGFKLLSFVHYGTNYQNAFWDGQRMTYGDGGGSYKIFTALDVCGHEISHGLTSNTSNLMYQNESGALNESYSDIFGASIENFARPSNWNWKIGEDLTNSGNGLRTMANPNQFGDPDTYGGTSWYTGTADNGGVHTNSGVSNYWYYLLTQGGSGTNDIGNTFSVTGIGFNSASRIAFRALTVYYTPTTNYATARLLSIQAAKDLFGDCSNETIQTINAWHAVGIGNKFTPGVIGSDFKGDALNLCSVP